MVTLSVELLWQTNKGRGPLREGPGARSVPRPRPASVGPPTCAAAGRQPSKTDPRQRTEPSEQHQIPPPVPTAESVNSLPPCRLPSTGKRKEAAALASAAKRDEDGGEGLGAGRAAVRHVRRGRRAAILPVGRRVPLRRVRRARARGRDRVPPRAGLALRGLRARARRGHMPRRRRRALRSMRRRHPLRQPARQPPRATPRRAILRRALLRRRADPGPPPLPLPGHCRRDAGGCAGRRRERRGRGGVVAPHRARRQPRGQRRQRRRVLRHPLRRVQPRPRSGLRAVIGRGQGHRGAGRAVRARPRRRRPLLPRTLHEPQRVVLGGGRGAGRAVSRRCARAGAVGGGEQRQGQGGPADAVPGEAQEPAVPQDHPLRVPQGLRRDAAAHQGPLRQAHRRRRRRRRAGARRAVLARLVHGPGLGRGLRRRAVLLRDGGRPCCCL